jgi:L-ascorbate metabolism protein UlaG (beta-lactamase superfamily)
VGGATILSASTASEVINLIEPRVVIPMHYRTEAYTGPAELEPVAKFLKEMGLQEGENGDSLRIAPATLPEETRVMVLKYKGQP